MTEDESNLDIEPEILSQDWDNKEAFFIPTGGGGYNTGNSGHYNTGTYGYYNTSHS